MKYGVYLRPKPERAISGDAYTIREAEGSVLLGLADGLGSGEEAARASRLAVACIEEHASLPLVEILQRCHFALRNTRGVVLGLLRVDLQAGQVRYAGVGNIGIYALTREPFHPISYNGIVGYRLPRVHEFVAPYHPGDLFVLYSDGVNGAFHGNEALLRTEEDPQEIAGTIARLYGRPDDDVSVLVAR
jgi:serine phosphatase RsbU (regulator of sigma subunit)